MRHNQYVFLAFGWMLVATLAARADDSAAARALVDKAIKAQGGLEKLSKVPAVTAKMKGTFHGMGVAMPFTGEVTTQGADRQKLVIESEFMGMQFTFTQILNGDKGWVRVINETMALDKDKLAEAKEQAYAEWVATLVPLKDKAFTLSTVGEVNIDKRPVVGVQVSRKGHRDVNLFFDKQTNLLVKTETRVKDEAGKEWTQETFLSDYKDVKNVKHSMKFTIKRDDKLFLEGEVTEYQLSEKLDDSVFAKP